MTDERAPRFDPARWPHLSNIYVPSTTTSAGTTGASAAKPTETSSAPPSPAKPTTPAPVTPPPAAPPAPDDDVDLATLLDDGTPSDETEPDQEAPADEAPAPAPAPIVVPTPAPSTEPADAATRPASSDSTSAEATPTRRASWRIPVLGALICLIVGGLIGALIMAAVRPRASSSTSTPARVTAAVAQQPLRSAYQLTGTVSAPQTVTVMPNAPTPAAAQTVTARVPAAGTTIHTLDVISEVTQYPIFAFPASVPLVRNLVGGTSGADVTAVQQILISAGLLTGQPTGTVDTATSKAFDALYKRAGYNPPRANPLVPNPDFPTGAQPALLLADTASLPDAALANGLVVVSAAQQGQTIGASQPLATLQTVPALITARVPQAQADGFGVGAAVSVQIGAGAAAPSTVLGVSAYQAGDGTTAAGYDITIGLPDGADPASSVGQTVTIAETAEPPTGLAVPVTAVRTDADGSFVYVASSDANTPDQKVSVTITEQSGGYAFFADNPNLPSGAQVVVSGERS